MAFEQVKVVGADNQLYGPVDIETVRQWIQQRRVVGETELIDEASGQRLTARELPALAGLFAVGGSVPPPPPPLMQPPTAPYAAGMQVRSDKSFLAALLLALFLGGFGVHRFYLGYTGTGVIQLLTCGGCGIWALVDTIMIAAGSLTDVNGLPLRD